MIFTYKVFCRNIFFSNSKRCGIQLYQEIHILDKKQLYLMVLVKKDGFIFVLLHLRFRHVHK